MPRYVFDAWERAEISHIGRVSGCHTCGTLDPGTPSGNFVCDLQPPTAVNHAGRPQRIYPACLACNVTQGRMVRVLRQQK